MLTRMDRVVAITPVPTTRYYIVDRDYTFVWDGKSTIVPRRFRFNGASIPCLFWQLTSSPYNPQIIRAALVHDYLYTTHCMDGGEALSRSKADFIFREITRSDGIGGIRRWLMYFALRVAGWWAWRSAFRNQQKLSAARRSKRRALEREQISKEQFDRYSFPAADASQAMSSSNDTRT